jgi:hypothetical protein
MGLSLSVSADVLVFAEITKDKDIFVTENIVIDKDIDIIVTVVDIADKAAEAAAIGNQTNDDNNACENCAEKEALIRGSILVNLGIINTNQATGNMNNHGNLVSVAVDADNGNGDNGNGDQEESEYGFANAQASVEQKSTINIIESVSIEFRNSFIRESVNGNEGIVGVNQSSGNISNQMNATAIAACLGGAVALSEADLGQSTTSSTVTEIDVVKTAEITGSVLDNHGIVFVNQTSGILGNQSNVLSLAVALSAFEL